VLFVLKRRWFVRALRRKCLTLPIPKSHRMLLVEGAWLATLYRY